MILNEVSRIDVIDQFQLSVLPESQAGVKAAKKELLRHIKSSPGDLHSVSEFLHLSKQDVGASAIKACDWISSLMNAGSLEFYWLMVTGIKAGQEAPVLIIRAHFQNPFERIFDKLMQKLLKEHP